MYRKFYKLLIVGNSHPTILFIPTGNDGIMEWWNNGIIAFHAMICQGNSDAQTTSHKLKLKNFLLGPEAGACSLGAPPQAFICPKGAIPSFHFCNIPSFQF
jgi:hypothetical protein